MKSAELNPCSRPLFPENNGRRIYDLRRRCSRRHNLLRGRPSAAATRRSPRSLVVSAISGDEHATLIREPEPGGMSARATKTAGLRRLSLRSVKITRPCRCEPAPSDYSASFSRPNLTAERHRDGQNPCAPTSNPLASLSEYSRSRTLHAVLGPRETRAAELAAAAREQLGKAVLSGASERPAPRSRT